MALSTLLATVNPIAATTQKSSCRPSPDHPNAQASPHRSNANDSLLYFPTLEHKARAKTSLPAQQNDRLASASVLPNQKIRKQKVFHNIRIITFLDLEQEYSAHGLWYFCSDHEPDHPHIRAFTKTDAHTHITNNGALALTMNLTIHT